MGQWAGEGETGTEEAVWASRRCTSSWQSLAPGWSPALPTPPISLPGEKGTQLPQTPLCFDHQEGQQVTKMSGFLRFNRTNVRMRSKPGSPDALTYSTKSVVLDKLMTWRALSLTLQCASDGSPSLR